MVGNEPLEGPQGLVGQFVDQYGRPPGHIVRSPGRVNLIGDHTDYNDGFALPMAIDQCIWVLSASRDDREIALRSKYAGDARLHLDRLERSGSWVDYVAGVLVNLVLPERGFDALIHSEVPIGAGLPHRPRSSWQSPGSALNWLRRRGTPTQLLSPAKRPRTTSSVSPPVSWTSWRLLGHIGATLS